MVIYGTNKKYLFSVMDLSGHLLVVLTLSFPFKWEVVNLNESYI